MATTARRRSALLAGLFILSLILLATSLDTAPAMRDTGSAGGSDSTTTTSATSAQLRAEQVKQAQLDREHALTLPAFAAPGTVSGDATTIFWVLLAIAAGGALIGALVLLRRRQQTRFVASTGSIAYCRVHPDDATCGVA